ncbi:hypothetical protein SCB49_08288 [unidentified eubacterium SCB49]|nr:hypothetical protein SCB49_08288 [unidentified eubacterium SCB49]
MKKNNLLLSIVFCLMTIVLNAQSIKGVATYKTDTKMDMKIDSTKMNVDLQVSLMAQLRKQMQKEYTLDFNAEESIYTEVPKLDAPSAPSSSGIKIEFSGGTDILYRNTKESLVVNETEIMSKPFLIKDTAVKPAWVLEKDIKSIGNYTCFKATWTRDVEKQRFDSLKKEMVKETVSKTTTAWYTLDLPVQHGPSTFWGLPGLILEIEDGKQTILCSKVVLNPEKSKEIVQPTKGKEVTQEEYDAISEKKNAEMMEQFQQRSSKRKGSVNTIQIGG